MSISIVRHIVLIVTLCVSAAANAAPLTLLTDTLAPPESPQELPLPEPAALEPGWLKYFDGEGEKLDEKVQKALARLDSLPDELPGEIKEAAKNHIELIKANLQALPQARAQTAPEPPPPIVHAEQYTLAQVLDLYQRLHDTRVELQESREDFDTIEQAVKEIRKRTDTLMAAYLGLQPSNPERLIKGLEIMAETSEISVADERLRVRGAALTGQETQFKQLQQELAVARKRIVAQYADLARLNGDIEETTAELEKARAHLLKKQTAAQGIITDDPGENATANYRQLLVTRALVQVATIDIRLIKLQTERHLVSLLLGTVGMDTKALREQLSNWQTTLRKQRAVLTVWTNESERERGRTGAAMANLREQSSASNPSFVQQINQQRFELAQETLITVQYLQDEMLQTEFVIQLVDEQLLLREGTLKNWLARTEQAIEQLWANVWASFSSSLFKIGATPVTTLGLLRIALILSVAWLISYWLRRALKQLGGRSEGTYIAAYYTVGRLGHYLLISLGLIIGLSSIGMDFTNFALVAGALAIGIGFGLQAIVNNFISGLILLFERSLKVGDFVELASGVAGEVTEINVRSTVINTNDNVDIVVPNSEFMNTNVVNWTLVENYRRIHLPFKVAYGTDKELVRQAGLEAAEKVPHTLTGIPGKNPGVWLVGFGESSLSFELVVWVTPRAVKRPGAVNAAYMWEIETALCKYGIKIPYPQRDLHLRSGFRGLLEEENELQAPEHVPALRLEK